MSESLRGVRLHPDRWTRRQFLASTSVATVFGLVPRRLMAQAPSAPAVTFTLLRRDVGIFT
jgi:hypothetical protein